MKSGIWMFCVLFFMFIVAPILMVLTFLGPLGPLGAGPGTVFMYWLPVLLCAVSVTALIFYRQGMQGKQA